jgi:hypothetical protein
MFHWYIVWNYYCADIAATGILLVIVNVDMQEKSTPQNLKKSKNLICSPREYAFC